MHFLISLLGCGKLKTITLPFVPAGSLPLGYLERRGAIRRPSKDSTRRVMLYKMLIRL
jgi:hypothetical protein